ncbi:uridylate kinase [Mesorhizobium amorphae]|uniref:aspartate kinase n=1 Tax=Mesorhizobium amorphae CCNWGS0123 TaxID=1082933 RepID=G6YMA9_9HYPH|nr:uridylate kinase [Mesorhizobium amorphae]ANT54519.1 uridylate kinase [Mesorhizobium amorphae CCNWGS0123]EHH02117.1 aspartate/glutamate/uridylate kinase [Mesorhizobium amorphae CCNWGS0123]
MNTTILKFGGSSFLYPDDYGRVAGHIADRLAAGEKKIVAVVSAMSGTTDKLKAVMLDVNKQASPSNLDAALATGEMLSACLLEAAVSRLGITVMSLNGYSLGIRTNSDFGRASVESVDPKPIIAALLEHDVVIAAGAQAIDESGRLNFLGRNSSDLTAIVIASMLGEHACEIYSDVPGVYTADPYLVPQAQLIAEIAYGTIAQMSRHGAKVLHHKAVDYAEKHAVAIVCKSLTRDGAVTGTIVTGHGNARSVTVARDAAVLLCASLAERDNLGAFLERHDISAICVEDNCAVSICIMSDIDFAMRLVELASPRPVSIEPRTAVTELDSSVLRVHLDRDYERAVSLARQIHERMYPGAVAERLGPRKDRQRSAYRSLLIRANKAQGDLQ